MVFECKLTTDDKLSQFNNIFDCRNWSGKPLDGEYHFYMGIISGSLFMDLLTDDEFYEFTSTVSNLLAHDDLDGAYSYAESKVMESGVFYDAVISGNMATVVRGIEQLNSIVDTARVAVDIMDAIDAGDYTSFKEWVKERIDEPNATAIFDYFIKAKPSHRP